MAKNPFIIPKAKPLNTIPLKKSGGILDDHAVRKNMATKEGTIEKTPVNSNDIVNKAYVDSEINSLNIIDWTNATEDLETTGTGNFGVAEVGTWDFGAGAYAAFGHEDFIQTSGGTAFRQRDTGEVYFNAVNNKNFHIQNGGETYALFTKFGATYNNQKKSSKDFQVRSASVANGGVEDVPIIYTDTTNALFGVGETPQSGCRVSINGSIKLKEQSAAGADTAAYGQLWIKDDSPNALYFTDDAGNDREIMWSGAIDVSDLNSSAVITESEGISSNDNDTTIPTSAAVKDYVDTNILTPTREIFVVPSADNLADDGPIGYFSYVALVDGEHCYFTFRVPHDYTSLTECKLIVIPDATETIQYDVSATWGAAGEEYYTNVGETLTDATASATTDQLLELDVTDALTGTPVTGEDILAGEYVGLRFTSNTTQIRVIGLRFKYT